ncbi:hypothetical protein G9G84_27935, partial [Klebsiella pneumoniae]|uniref:hypothetical protein n=1 Tax=Klebsiella pneumoniae TaxID=573 RepID=UPI0015E6988B
RDLQWRVALLLDRKRVNLTCSMEPRGRELRMHRDLCLALANAIELRLAHDAPEEECLAVWEQAAAVVDRSMRRHRLAFLLIVQLFFAPLAI